METRKEEGRVAVAARTGARKEAKLAKVPGTRAAKAVEAAKRCSRMYLFRLGFTCTLPGTRYTTAASLYTFDTS